MFVVVQSSQAAISKYRMRVNLSAHIIDSSIANLKETNWTLYKTTVISGGDDATQNNMISTKIQSFTGAIKSLTLPVGQYVIKAKYGDAVSAKIFKVEETAAQNFLNLKVVFNLGGLQLSSSIGASQSIIEDGVNYIIRNLETSKIVFETDDVTRVFYLNEGEYNVTAKFQDIVVTDAKFKILANNINNVNIQHKVGQVNLNIDNIQANISDIPPTWRIIGQKNGFNQEINTTENESLLLLADDYKLLIEWQNYTYEQEFSLKPAQIIEFKIPKQLVD